MSFDFGEGEDTWYDSKPLDPNENRSSNAVQLFSRSIQLSNLKKAIGEM